MHIGSLTFSHIIYIYIFFWGITILLIGIRQNRTWRFDTNDCTNLLMILKQEVKVLQILTISNEHLNIFC